MIATQTFWMDFLIHASIIYMITLYFKYIMKQPSILIPTIAAALLITYINHHYFPTFALSRFLVIE